MTNRGKSSTSGCLLFHPILPIWPQFYFMKPAVYCLTMGKICHIIYSGDEVKAAEKGPLLRPPPHWSTSHQTRVDVKLIVVVTLMFSPSLFSLLSTLMLPAAFASAHCAKSPFFGPKIQFRWNMVNLRPFEAISSHFGQLRPFEVIETIWGHWDHIMPFEAI